MPATFARSWFSRCSRAPHLPEFIKADGVKWSKMLRDANIRID